jgi:hypothetical protein
MALGPRVAKTLVNLVGPSAIWSYEWPEWVVKGHQSMSQNGQHLPVNAAAQIADKRMLRIVAIDCAFARSSGEGHVEVTFGKARRDDFTPGARSSMCRAHRHPGGSHARKLVRL